MDTKVSYTLVGLFVIVFGLALIGSVLWLTAGAQDKTYALYQIYVRESVAGLNPQAAVSYRGVNVGQVEDIELDPEDPRRVILTLSIEQGTPIKEDTFATLSFQGLTGLATVELSGGSPDSPLLQAGPGEEYPVIESVPSLVKRLDDAFTDMVEGFDRFSSRMDALLSPENQRAVSETLANLSKISGTIAARTDSIERTLDTLAKFNAVLGEDGALLEQAIANAAITLANSARISAELAPLLTRLSSAAAAVEAMAQSIIKTSDDLDVAVVATGKDLRRLLRRTGPELDSLLQELSRLTEGLQRLINELGRNPQSLLLGNPARRPGPGE